MARKTVLNYVQAALNAMDSDLVDSINDTEEALQVANELQDTYYELLNREDWEFLHQPSRLTGAADTSNPTKLLIENEIKRFDYIAYLVDSKAKTLTYLSPVEFLKRFSAGGTNRLQVTDGAGVNFYVDTDRNPEYFTSFDDESIVCDAYDSAIESTLQGSKTSCIGVVIPTFSVTDTHVPDIPQHMEPLLQSALNAASFSYFKQSASAKDEQRTLRQLAQARREESKVISHKDYYANKFGRR